MKFDQQSAQRRVDEIQAVYREWLALQPKLERAEQDWRRSIELMAEMEAFYFGEAESSSDYSLLHEAEEQGLALDWTTEGEYSVLSEDALWNAFHEQQTLAWRRLRSALAVLDKEGG
ncbi:MAG: DUF4298 domain-containing protein [Neisseria sp.]|nr:DUF4298 domain-containing protein [Neisseria sp.]